MNKNVLKIVCEVIIAALTALVTAFAASSCQTSLKATDIQYNGSIGNHCKLDSVH